MSKESKKISRKELRKLLGDMASGTFRMNINRGNIIEEDGLIDVLTTSNREWIIDYCNKNIIDWNPIFENGISKVSSNTSTKPVRQMPPKPKANTVRHDYLPDRANIAKKKLEEETEIKRIKKETDELKLLAAKKELLPVDLVVELFKIYIPGLTSDIEVNVYKLIERLIDELKGDYEMKLRYKKELYKVINSTHESSHVKLSNNIISEAKKFKYKWNS